MYEKGKKRGESSRSDKSATYGKGSKRRKGKIMIIEKEQ